MSGHSLEPTAALGRLPGLMCSTTGCKREVAEGCMCAEHYEFYIKLHKAYVECLEYKTIAENAMKCGLEECKRLRSYLARYEYELDEDELSF